MEDEEEQGSSVPRIAAGAALVLMAVLAVYVLLLRDDGYTVKARFRAVSVLVPGNVVKIAGDRAGTVTDIDLAPDGVAEVTLKLDRDFAPLRTGTRATIRAQSLSGSASRYVDLRIPAAGGRTLPEGSVIDEASTSTDVDLDQFFSLFDDRTQEGPAEHDPRLGAAVRRARRGGQRGLRVPQPVAARRAAPVPRGQPRHAGAAGLPRVELAAGGRHRRAARRRWPGSSTASRR